MLAQGISLAAQESAHLAVDHTRLGAAGRAAGLPQGGTGDRWGRIALVAAIDTDLLVLRLLPLDCGISAFL